MYLIHRSERIFVINILLISTFLYTNVLISPTKILWISKLTCFRYLNSNFYGVICVSTTILIIQHWLRSVSNYLLLLFNYSAKNSLELFMWRGRITLHTFVNSSRQHLLIILIDLCVWMIDQWSVNLFPTLLHVLVSWKKSYGNSRCIKILTR